MTKKERTQEQVVSLVKRWFKRTIQSLQGKIEAQRETIEQLEIRIKELEKLSTIDELTGLLNRRGFDPELCNRIADLNCLNRNERVGFDHKVSDVLLYIDLESFKAINDQAGHVIGDQILYEVSDAISTALRRKDVIARYGGDEFVALVQVHNQYHLDDIVDRVRSAVEDVFVFENERKWQVGASVGVKILEPGDTLKSVLAEADSRMYKDKERRKACR